MYVCTYVCMYVCIYVCMYIRMYVYMYVRMYVCEEDNDLFGIGNRTKWEMSEHFLISKFILLC